MVNWGSGDLPPEEDSATKLSTTPENQDWRDGKNSVGRAILAPPTSPHGRGQRGQLPILPASVGVPGNKTSRKCAEGMIAQLGMCTGIYTCNSLTSLLPNKGMQLPSELLSFIC